MGQNLRDCVRYCQNSKDSLKNDSTAGLIVVSSGVPHVSMAETH